MGHVESAHLVELALGNTSGDEDAGALRHIAACPFCREELTALTRLVNAARDAQAVDLATAPPARLWQRISEEVTRESRTLPHPGRRSAAGAACGDRLTRPAGVTGPGGLLAVALAAGAAAAAVAVRRWWTRTGQGRLRGPARRFHARTRTTPRTHPGRRRR
ncbi:hypothetical protein SAM40697_6374 [Streptomyces ambofaciens]|uniref:Zinc-finger domain-containing protein n=1 Tax=Streptomyces ambofaciens TaxID=1889 RepID=A0ABN4PL05_STRAM|nr:hypothetical protein [Streptomyces ambofaciens]ANB10327.1 hypothetical protein SAM40697_6374 [Streptomyces ambofaciens]